MFASFGRVSASKRLPEFPPDCGVETASKILHSCLVPGRRLTTGIRPIVSAFPGCEWGGGQSGRRVSLTYVHRSFEDGLKGLTLLSLQ